MTHLKVPSAADSDDEYEHAMQTADDVEDPFPSGEKMWRCEVRDEGRIELLLHAQEHYNQPQRGQD